MRKKYQRKLQTVWALKTYIGQPMADVRDFLLTSTSSLYISPSCEGSRFVEPIEGDLNITPGDYLVVSDNGKVTTCSAEEFEKEYEEQVDSTELLYVIRTYGFPVKDAEYMLRDEKIRNILLAPLHEQRKASRRSRTANHINSQSNVDVDVDRVVKQINKHLEEALNSVSPRQ